MMIICVAFQTLAYLTCLFTDFFARSLARLAGCVLLAFLLLCLKSSLFLVCCSVLFCSVLLFSVLLCSFFFVTSHFSTLYHYSSRAGRWVVVSGCVWGEACAWEWGDCLFCFEFVWFCVFVFSCLCVCVFISGVSRGGKGFEASRVRSEMATEFSRRVATARFDTGVVDTNIIARTARVKEAPRSLILSFKEVQRLKFNAGGADCFPVSLDGNL